MKRLMFFLLLVVGSYGCSRFGCENLTECEDILTDVIEINLFQNGMRVATLSAMTQKNGDHIVLNDTLPDCPGLPQILADTVSVTVRDSKTRMLLDELSAITRKNGDRIQLASVVSAEPETIAVKVPEFVVDERFVIGPGKHQATQFKLCGYVIDESNDSETGKNVELCEDLSDGQIEAWFRGKAAPYAIKIKVENDARITNTYALWLNGKQVKEWLLPGDTTDKQVVLEADGELTSPAFIEIRAKAEKQKDAAEIDYVELVEKQLTQRN